MEVDETALFSSKSSLLISAGPQKYKHKVGHNYFTVELTKKLEVFFLIKKIRVIF
jgi:hypothetical protein